MSFKYQMRFAKTGRARYIAHLDTLSCLVRAVRRTGFDLAYTQGMRPKPILSLAMPLGVGVEGEDEICEFALKQRAPVDELARRLSRELPEGITMKSVGPNFDSSKAASRVASVSYRVDLNKAPPDLAEAADGYNAAGSFVTIRQRPKGDKEVDIKKYIRHIDVCGDAAVCFDMEVTHEGTGRPEEAVAALGSFTAGGLEIGRIIRTAIELREEEKKRPPRKPRPRSRGRWS